VTGDVSFAEEPAQASITMQPEAPKETKQTNKQTHKAVKEPTNGTAEPTNGAEVETEVAADAAGAVIALAGRIRDAKAAETPVAARANDLVTVRAKPEKRKNYKERAKAKFAKSDSKEDTEDGTTPDTTAKAKSEVIEKAKAEKKAKAKVERQKAKAARKAKKSKSAA